MTSWLHRKQVSLILLNAGLLCLAGLVASLVAASYVSAERFFYYWDLGAYEVNAANIAGSFSQSPLATTRLVLESVEQEYNFFYALPLVPFILLFGGTRLSYVLGVTLAFQLPFALVIGGIAVKLIRAMSLPVFWSTVFLVILTPYTWWATLRGYPDVAAALMIGLAFWIYLLDMRLRRWWQIVLIGVAMALAVLLRRHFSYDVIAFFLTLACLALSQSILESRSHPGSAVRSLSAVGAPIILIGAMALLVLLLVGRPFLERITSTNYITLYSSYSVEVSQMLRFFLEKYGWITLGLAAAGFVLGMIKHTVHLPAAASLLLFGIISFLEWIFVVRQRGVHYLLHTTPIVILGLAAFFWTLWIILKGRARLLVMVSGAAIILWNFVGGFVSLPLPVSTGLFFSSSEPPLRRTDYDEVVRLIQFMRDNISEGETVYIVDSSALMNRDLFEIAEKKLFGEPKVRVLRSPQIDSRDFYPLEMLLEADYVIVSTPFQYHLADPGEQKVVKVVYEAFRDGWEVAQDFELLPAQFNLQDGVDLAIYKRVRPTSLETALATFAKMVEYIGRRPGQQLDWIAISKPRDLTLSKIEDRHYRLEVPLTGSDPQSSVALLYAQQAPNQSSIQGTLEFLDESCHDLTLVLEAVDLQGKVVQSAVHQFSSPPSDSPFSLDLAVPAGSYLIFNVEPTDQASVLDCRIILDWEMADESKSP